MKMRKKSSGGGANWMDTYGDMVTLLLCFFVLLYSMSTISEEKWKMLVASFNPDAALTMTESSGNDGPNADPDEMDGSGMGLSQVDIDNDMAELYEMIMSYVSQQNAQDNISVSKGDGKVFITFNQAIFFDGDDWQLREESKPILEMIAAMLSEVAGSIDEVRVMGHTAQGSPNKPNNITVDRLLSAQRAANTVAYIQQFCTLDPARLISEAYGQWRPVAPNDTAEGRAQNRRVEMIISGRNLEEELANGIQNYYTNENVPTVDITGNDEGDSGTTTNTTEDGVPAGSDTGENAGEDAGMDIGENTGEDTGEGAGEDADEDAGSDNGTGEGQE